MRTYTDGGRRVANWALIAWHFNGSMETLRCSPSYDRLAEDCERREQRETRRAGRLNLEPCRETRFAVIPATDAP